MATVYSLKNGVKLDSLEELGYTFFKDTFSALKVVKQDIDSHPVRYLLNNYYENPKWIETIYKKNKKAIKKQLDVAYDKEGKLIFTPKLIELLTTWFIQIDGNDCNWVGITSGDKFDSYVFYNKHTLDSYFEKEIKLLKEHDLIEELEVTE